MPPLPTESLEDLISGSAATVDAVAQSLKATLKEDVSMSGMPKQSKQASSQVHTGNTTGAANLASTLSVKVRVNHGRCSWASCIISSDPDLDRI